MKTYIDTYEKYRTTLERLEFVRNYMFVDTTNELIKEYSILKASIKEYEISFLGIKNNEN